MDTTRTRRGKRRGVVLDAKSEPTPDRRRVLPVLELLK
jgi:hypothetical protein